MEEGQSKKIAIIVGLLFCVSKATVYRAIKDENQEENQQEEKEHLSTKLKSTFFEQLKLIVYGFYERSLSPTVEMVRKEVIRIMIEGGESNFNINEKTPENTQEIKIQIWKSGI